MKVCGVTCTGARPELFALCKRWVMRQTVPVDHWIVATDNGEVIEDLPPMAQHHHVTPALDAPTLDWKPNSSLQQALALVPKDHAAVVFEDDDWYGRTHVQVCMRGIADGHLVSYGARVVQFNVPLATWRMHKEPPPSEGRVCIHPDGIERYAHSLLNRPLWSGPTDGRHADITTAGIKGVGFGLPGRAGATIPHFQASHWAPDPGHKMMRRLLGEDALAYTALLDPSKAPPRMSHKHQRRFCEHLRAVMPEQFVGAKVLDVGSFDVNGNNRYLFRGGSFLGIDMIAGKGVDRVCTVHEVLGPFSVVISTEALEHDPEWRKTLKAMSDRVSAGGLLIMTCAGPGRLEHGTRKCPMPGMANEGDYYQNLSPVDILCGLPLEQYSAYDVHYHDINFDTYFWGKKK